MKKVISVSPKKEKAFLIGVHPKSQSKEDYDYSMSELRQLTETAEIIVVETFTQALERPDHATLVGKGKLDEIKSLLDEYEITTLIFNDNLTPVQARNIAEKTQCNIVDRTELILDIFAKHAQTAESRLQVELAQLEYSYTKLRHLWQHFSRIGGGAVGVRGPGETQIEIDRRLIKKRISLLKDKLDDVKKTTETKRKKRSNQISICLVGYTNAGKSTLFNALTKENIYTADKLFATLDSTTRAMDLGVRNDMPPPCSLQSGGGEGGDNSEFRTPNSELHSMLTDTIGFIENLPPTLIQSFYSTLSEVREADLLLHVVDVNNPKKMEHIETVNKILKDIKADNKDTILVFNKCDVTGNAGILPANNKDIIDKMPAFPVIEISAKTGENLNDLKNSIKNFLSLRKINKKFIIPANLENIISYLHNYTEIISLEYIPETHIYKCETLIDKKLIKNIEEQIDKFSLINFYGKQ